MAAFLALLVISAPLFEMVPGDVDVYLRSLNERECAYGARVARVAQDFLGAPYAADPLGEGPGAAIDSDPLIDLTRVDCVTFVEQVLALAASASHKEAVDVLQSIRYRNGKVAFEARNHFMIADWIANNAFCRDATSSLDASTAAVKRTIGRKHFFNLKDLPELAQTAMDQEITLQYVPVETAKAAEAALPSPALILLIGKVDWLFTLHCGLYARDESGRGLFYNASSKEGKVVAPLFSDVFENTTRYIGFTAYEINMPSKSVTSAP